MCKAADWLQRDRKAADYGSTDVLEYAIRKKYGVHFRTYAIATAG